MLFAVVFIWISSGINPCIKKWAMFLPYSVLLDFSIRKPGSILDGCTNYSIYQMSYALWQKLLLLYLILSSILPAHSFCLCCWCCCCTLSLLAGDTTECTYNPAQYTLTVHISEPTLWLTWYPTCKCSPNSNIVSQLSICLDGLTNL
jgi:hypothetical protein